jgi:hypothetical protein
MVGGQRAQYRPQREHSNVYHHDQYEHQRLMLMLMLNWQQ